MILVLHIVLALAGIGIATAAVVAPREWSIRAVWGLIAGTVVSGVFAGLQTHATWQSLCMTGLAYSAGVGVLGLVARYRLQKQTVRTSRD